MNCSNCGTEIPIDERFCRNCGKEEVPLAPSVGRNAPTVPFSQPPNTAPFNPYGETANVSSPPPKTVSFNSYGENANVSSPPPETVPFSPYGGAAANSSPPFGHVPKTPVAAKAGSSILVRVTIASIIIAFVSISVLAYFIFTRPKVDQRTSTAPEEPTTTASPSATNSSATPTPTVQPTTTPTSSPTPTPTPSNEPPPGARLAYCNDTNVLVRSAPDLNARPVTKLTRGQNIWVIGSSSNYSTWKGITSNWTQVQMYKGTLRGWVFSPFVSYAAENE